MTLHLSIRPLQIYFFIFQLSLTSSSGLQFDFILYHQIRVLEEAKFYLGTIQLIILQHETFHFVRLFYKKFFMCMGFFGSFQSWTFTIIALELKGYCLWSTIFVCEINFLINYFVITSTFKLCNMASMGPLLWFWDNHGWRKYFYSVLNCNFLLLVDFTGTSVCSCSLSPTLSFFQWQYRSLMMISQQDGLCLTVYQIQSFWLTLLSTSEQVGAICYILSHIIDM